MTVHLHAGKDEVPLPEFPVWHTICHQVLGVQIPSYADVTDGIVRLQGAASSDSADQIYRHIQTGLQLFCRF